MFSTITGREYRPQCGAMVRPDGWPVAQRVISGDSFSTFRVETGLAVVESVAAEIEITGATVRRDTKTGAAALRCRVRFVGDCEPDTIVNGWIMANGCEVQ